MLGFTTRLVFLKQTFLVHDNFLIREQLCEQAQLLPPPLGSTIFQGAYSAVLFINSFSDSVL